MNQVSYVTYPQGHDQEYPPALRRPRVRLFAIILEQLYKIHEKSHEVRLFCDAGTVVFIDRTEFAQMLDSYLHNALTHGRPPIDLRATQQGGWVNIRVCDHGPGVSGAALRHLFGPFSGTAGNHEHNHEHSGETGGRTGGELWLTRRRARANGGDTWYEPHQPHGACFCLRLTAKPAVAL